MPDSRSRQDLVPLGRVSGVHGVRGWIKIFSYTEPRDNIVGYRHWILAREGVLTEAVVEDGQAHGQTVIAKLEGTDDRDAAREWIDAEILVPRSALPELEPGEYYWRDLEGLAVESTTGEALGHVDHLIETGAHDVLVLDGGPDRLIPFVPGRIVVDVDLEAGRIVVEWSSEYWD